MQCPSVEQCYRGCSALQCSAVAECRAVQSTEVQLSRHQCSVLQWPSVEQCRGVGSAAHGLRVMPVYIYLSRYTGNLTTTHTVVINMKLVQMY